jgi:hypothetical protein
LAASGSKQNWCDGDRFAALCSQALVKSRWRQSQSAVEGGLADEAVGEDVDELGRFAAEES